MRENAKINETVYLRKERAILFGGFIGLAHEFKNDPNMFS
jgi:hypothetical protein